MTKIYNVLFSFCCFATIIILSAVYRSEAFLLSILSLEILTVIYFLDFVRRG